jgi:transposase
MMIPFSFIILSWISYTQQAILNAGHILLFMPPYSPDLNHIEKKWAQAKALRRKLRCDTQTLFASHFF